jgi:hypothetical protein
MLGIGQTVAHWSFSDAFPKARIIDERGCTRWLWCGMPLIPPQVLNCCFYLYKTKGDARSGRPFGGTGFLLAVPSQVDERVFHTFGVTNWHVAVRDGCSVIRVNKVGGGVDILDRDPSEWIFRSKWHDLAIIGMPDTDEAMTAIHRQMLLSREETAALEIWSGADVFMVGRFVDHDGRSTNHPSVRFGHISVMPVSGITQPTGKLRSPRPFPYGIFGLAYVCLPDAWRGSAEIDDGDRPRHGFCETARSALGPVPGKMEAHCDRQSEAIVATASLYWRSGD